MSSAWFMDDDISTDQREVHRSSSEPADVDMSELAGLGVLSWKVLFLLLHSLQIFHLFPIFNSWILQTMKAKRELLTS